MFDGLHTSPRSACFTCLNPIVLECPRGPPPKYLLELRLTATGLRTWTPNISKPGASLPGHQFRPLFGFNNPLEETRVLEHIQRLHVPKQDAALVWGGWGIGDWWEKCHHYLWLSQVEHSQKALRQWIRGHHVFCFNAGGLLLSEDKIKSQKALKETCVQVQRVFANRFPYHSSKRTHTHGNRVKKQDMCQFCVSFWESIGYPQSRGELLGCWDLGLSPPALYTSSRMKYALLPLH